MLTGKHDCCFVLCVNFRFWIYFELIFAIEMDLEFQKFETKCLEIRNKMFRNFLFRNIEIL